MGRSGILQLLVLVAIAIFCFGLIPFDLAEAVSSYQVTITKDAQLISDYDTLFPSAVTDIATSRPLFRMSLRRRACATVSSTRRSSEILRQAIRRSRRRVYALSNALARSLTFNTTVYAMDSEFVTSFDIGTPPQEITVIVDTGSDLVWTQCKPCSACFPQPQALYDPAKSSTYKELSCKNNKYCNFISDGARPSCSKQQTCSYSYGYGDGSNTDGILSEETITLTDNKGSKIPLPNFVFGCGHENGGDFSNTSGIVGLGLGFVSIISQLGSSIDNKFSYCLVNWDAPPTVTSSLLMGAASRVSGPGALSTPIIQNKKSTSFYYVTLHGVSVGGNLLNIPRGTFDIQPDGSGGLIVDSGTTITNLEDAGYQPILSAFKSLIPLKPVAHNNEGLDLCYKIPKSRNLAVPSLTFHFENANLTLPPENYFIVFDGLLCLAMASSSGLSILGNIQQQNFQLGFDVKGRVLSMKPTTCSKL